MLKKEKKIEAKEVDGETILLNQKKNEFFVLNKTGTTIWKNIKGKSTEKEISRILAKKYDLPEKKAFNDTKQLIKKLASLKLIKT